MGAGFWSTFQIAGWRELPDVAIAGLYSRDLGKAESIAARFGIPVVGDDPEALLRQVQPAVVDIVTSPDSHSSLASLAAGLGIAVITQKPMAATLEDAEALVQVCRSRGVPLFVHENFRWQRPIRRFREHLLSEGIGTTFRARLTFSSAFPVLENQPALRELDRFILSDVGVHILDVARFLFGEMRTVTCTTQRVDQELRGEDVATVLMTSESGATVICELSFASRLEHEAFPETLILVEAAGGSMRLDPGGRIVVTTSEGTTVETTPIPWYPWADPAYAVVHASIVDCNRDLLSGVVGLAPAETTGADNLRTLRLVEAAYRSAASGAVIPMAGYDERTGDFVPEGSPCASGVGVGDRR